MDVSFKALVDSRTSYHKRDLYTEMEMFIPASMAPDAVKEFQEYMETVKNQHNTSVGLFLGVRYVKQVCSVRASPPLSLAQH